MIYLFQISLLTERIIQLKLLFLRLPITYLPTWKRKGFTVLTLLLLIKVCFSSDCVWIAPHDSIWSDVELSFLKDSFETKI